MTPSQPAGPIPALRDRVERAVRAQQPFASAFLDRIRDENPDPAGGVLRDTYGAGENRGHRAMADAARDSGLEVTTDAAANTYARWAAQGGDGRSVLIGSHLDSVPRGGNFDGAAGVLAGLVALRALRDAGLRPLRDLIAMGIRAEESVWFEVSYIGSRAALGTLPEGTLERAHRIDTGRTLAQHITECGGDPDALRAGPTFAPDRIAAFLEVHIEQAPVLLETGDALGICTGIPGNVRYPAACILGRHQHVGTPRRFRHDTAVAGAVLAVELDRLWQRLEAEGTPAAITLGRFHTDADRHGLTTVPGLFHFSLDMRAQDPVVLARLEAELLALVARIEAEYRVTFQLGARASAAVGPMAADIRDDLAAAAAHHGVSHMMLGSPASHDAAAFGAAGVPVGMVLVRNENGSHTPEEAMEIEDFMAACVVVADWLARRHCQP